MSLKDKTINEVWHEFWAKVKRKYGAPVPEQEPADFEAARKSLQPSDEMWYRILHSMRKSPQDWTVSSHRITNKNGLSIWVENRPYADLTIDKPSVVKVRPNPEWLRKQLRHEIDRIASGSILNNLKL